MAIDIKFPMIIGGSSGSSFTFGKLPSNISSTTTTPAPAMGGQLWGWGWNNRGQLGDNTTAAKSSPVQTIAVGNNWSSVSSNGYFGTAIKTDGTLWTWGNNSPRGPLGDDTTTDRSSPVQTIAGGTNWSSVAAGTEHTAAIKTDGTLWLWGWNSAGPLGDNTTTDRSSPVQTIAGGTNWSKVTGGNNYTAAIKTDGTLWLWGSNIQGQLGDNTKTNKSSPVQTITGGTNWSSVACGNSVVAAIKTDGNLWMWGYNSYGQLGDNTLIHRSSPVQTIAGGTDWSKVAGGYTHIAAIKTDGTLWSWGRNSFGQLGDNSLTHTSSPVQTIAGGSDWTFVACGRNNTAAIKTDGTLWNWGENSYYGIYGGYLGDNTLTHKSSPVQTIKGGTGWVYVSGIKNVKSSFLAIYSE